MTDLVSEGSAAPRRNRRRAWIVGGVVGGLYLALSMAYCYPAVLSPGGQVLGFWDNLYFAWEMWLVNHNLFLRPQNLWITDLIYYPKPYITPIYQSIVVDFVAAAMMQVFSLTVTFNCLTIGSLFLAAVFMYMFLNEVFADRLAAFFGGALFAFHQNAIAHVVYGHINLLQTQWLPLFALSLIRLRRNPTPFTQFLFLISFILLGLTNPYYFIYLLAIYLGYAVAIEVLSRKRDWRFLANVVMLSCVGLMFVLLVYIPSSLGRYDSPDVAALKDIQQYTVYSNDFLNFFVPLPNHPLWRHFTTFWNGKILHGDTQFFGYSILALAIMSVFFLKWEGKRFWVGYGVLVSVLSLGPILMVAGQRTIGGMTVWLPYALFTKMPMVWGLRAPSRLNAAVVFAAAVLVAAALHALRAKMSRAWFRRLFVVLLPLMLYENIYLDPSVQSNTSLYRMPSVRAALPDSYKDIAATTDSLVLCELPAGDQGFCEIYNYRYMFYQTWHGKRIMAGKVPRFLTSYYEYQNTHPYVKYLYNPHWILSMTPEEWNATVDHLEEALVDIHVDYLILHPHENWLMPSGDYAALHAILTRTFGKRLERKPDGIWMVRLKKSGDARNNKDE